MRRLLVVMVALAALAGCDDETNDKNEDVAPDQLIDTASDGTDVTDDVPGDTAPGDTVPGDMPPEEVSDTAPQDVPGDTGPVDMADTGLQDVPGDTGPADAEDTADQTVLNDCALGGNECAPTEQCLPAGPNGALVCRTIGETAVGDSCSQAQDCVEGAICVAYDDTTSYCEVLCTDDIPCTDEAQTCVPWFGQTFEVAGICLGDACTPPSDGCPSGHRCTVILGAVFACFPDGTVPLGGNCSNASCQAGSICRDGQCRAFCDTTSECTTGEHCVWPWTDFTELGFCMEGCDPIAQTGCGANEACYFEDPEIGSTLCWAVGTLADGADCSNMELCEPGLDCVLEPESDPFEYYCRPYCDEDNPCTTGTCEATPGMPAMKVCMPS